MIYLTNRAVYNRTLELTRLAERAGDGPVTLDKVAGVAVCHSPGGFMYPTVPAVLRAAMGVFEPAFLAANAIPQKLSPMPDSYSPESDLSNIEVQALPHVPGRLGIDFAIAFAMCQLAAAAKVEREGMHEHAAYLVEAAGLSAAAVCSVASCEIMEKMYAAFQDDPHEVPWPAGVLWPSGVADWLAGFGFARDERG